MFSSYRRRWWWWSPTTETEIQFMEHADCRKMDAVRLRIAGRKLTASYKMWSVCVRKAFGWPELRIACKCGSICACSRNECTWRGCIEIETGILGVSRAFFGALLSQLMNTEEIENHFRIHLLIFCADFIARVESTLNWICAQMKNQQCLREQQLFAHEATTCLIRHSHGISAHEDFMLAHS